MYSFNFGALVNFEITQFYVMKIIHSENYVNRNYYINHLHVHVQRMELL